MKTWPDRRRPGAILAVCCLGVALAASAGPEAPPASPAPAPAADATGAAAAAFMDDCAALSRSPHRLTGSAEYAAAADYVAGRLREMGIEPVIEQPFPAVRLVTRRCELQVGGRNLRLYPLRPNGILPPATPEEGLGGRLLLAGAGRLQDYGNRSPAGRIVVMDFNCGDGWLRAFRLGARAVILVPGRETADGASAHYTEADANLPRFYYPGPAEDLVEDAEATLRSEVTWERCTGRNVIGFVPGGEPLFAVGRPETIVLAANLDSFGEVPDLTPAARGAANAAALLQIAGQLRRHPPRRNVAVVFFDAQAFGHAGSAAFYRAIEEDEPVLRLANRQARLAAEQDFLRQLAAAADRDAPRPGAPVFRECLRRLKVKADEHAFAVNAVMEDLRRNEQTARRQAGADTATRLADLQGQLAAHQDVKDQWNDLRRALAHRDVAAAARPPLRERFDTVLAELRADIATRGSELADAAAALAADEEIFERLGETWISLHASLLLGDATPRWGVVIGGDSCLHAGTDQAGLYGKVQKTLQDSAVAAGLRRFAVESTDGTVGARLFWPAPLVHSGEVAGRVGIYNVAFATCQERIPREGTPDDRIEALDLEAIRGQAGEIAALVAAAGNDDGLSLRRAIVAEKYYFLPEVLDDGTPRGPTVMGMTAGSTLANKPMPNTLVRLRTRTQAAVAFQPRKIPAFMDALYALSDANANYGFGPVIRDPDNWQLTGFAARFNARGEAVAVSDLASLKTVQTRLSLFPCEVRNLRDGRDEVSRRSGAVVLTPQTDPKEAKVLQALANGVLDPGKSHAATRDGVIYWHCEKRVEGVKVFGLDAAVGLNNGGEGPGFAGEGAAGGPYGSGFSLLVPWECPASAVRSAADLWRLNEHRLDSLRARGVMNSSVEELHARADDLLATAAATPSIARREALAGTAFLAERPVYDTVRSSLDDLVRAVLILLGLAIPFAFALERLLVGSTNIYRQILWFCGFFLVAFLLLYLVHPAFAVSNQPVIIFLAFALMLLSAMVIALIMQKFGAELKVLQGLRATVHSADVSRISTLLAAVSMGISTMRRRPLRTALTALTITLLTFTILNFASFDTRTGVVTLYRGAAPKQAAILLHPVNWAPLPEPVLELLDGRWGGQADIACRWWLPATADAEAPNPAPLVSRADGTQPLALRGVLGLDPHELALRPDIHAAFGAAPDALADGVFMTRTVAARLQVAPGDAVLVGGLRLRLAGLMDAAAAGAVEDLDGTGFLPVDFAAMTSSSGAPQAQPPAAAALAAANSRQDWVLLPVDSVVVVSADNARRLGASLRVATLYPHQPQASAGMAEDVARALPLPVVASRADGVYTHVLAPTLQAKGARDLLFPILLGGLVIFGTMLGSVADREKEIYTFSALGLAPVHVATLFFAEALVYAFIGGLGGYLLAQGMLKLLTALAAAGVLRSVPEMNYSSINAIITILIVMATVLVSAIYPAYKASRSANPGVLRTWRPPAPDGDRLHIVFPFTVSQYDITGVVSFLKEHFDNFSDTSLGVFMARQAALTRAGDGPGLKANLALAPFDLGVTQSFLLTSVPSEIPGIDEVTIAIVRTSGQRKDWIRLNRVLLDDLRRQFLIWRSLSQETMEHYRRQTLVALGQTPPAGPSGPDTGAAPTGHPAETHA